MVIHERLHPMSFGLLADDGAGLLIGIPYNSKSFGDLRDIIEQYASNEYISHKFHTFSWLDAFITKRFRKRLLRKRNNALEVADCVTTVSPWHVEVLKQYNPNVRRAMAANNNSGFRIAKLNNRPV